jgi:hypothetical protein
VVRVPKSSLPQDKRVVYQNGWEYQLSETASES